MPYDELDASKKPDLAIPYLLRPTRESLNSAIDSWAKICGADVVHGAGVEGGEKQVILMDFAKDGKSDFSSFIRDLTQRADFNRPRNGTCTRLSSSHASDRHAPIGREASRTSIPPPSFLNKLLGFFLFRLCHLFLLRISLFRSTQLDHPNGRTTPGPSPDPHDAHHYGCLDFLLDLLANHRFWDLGTCYYPSST